MGSSPSLMASMGFGVGPFPPLCLRTGRAGPDTPPRVEPNLNVTHYALAAMPPPLTKPITT